MGRSTFLLTLLLPLHLFGSDLSSSTLMLLVFVFTLLQERQDKFEVQSHEAKCKAVMLEICLFCLTVIGCRDCNIVKNLGLFDKLRFLCFV